MQPVGIGLAGLLPHGPAGAWVTGPVRTSTQIHKMYLGFQTVFDTVRHQRFVRIEADTEGRSYYGPSVG